MRGLSQGHQHPESLSGVSASLRRIVLNLRFKKINGVIYIIVQRRPGRSRTPTPRLRKIREGAVQSSLQILTQFVRWLPVQSEEWRKHRTRSSAFAIQ